jgi:hypothetical protein
MTNYQNVLIVFLNLLPHLNNNNNQRKKDISLSMKPFQQKFYEKIEIENFHSIENLMLNVKTLFILFFMDSKCR